MNVLSKFLVLILSITLISCQPSDKDSDSKVLYIQDQSVDINEASKVETDVEPNQDAVEVEISDEANGIPTKPNHIENKDIIQPEILDAGTKEWNKEWSFHIAESIDKYGQNLLESKLSENDLEAINCHGLNKATSSQKKQFWTVMFASMARYESNYKSKKARARNWRDVVRNAANKGPMGILQLHTGANAHGKGCSGTKSAQWLLNPKNNLQCSVQIMNNQLSGFDGKWPGVVGRLFPDEPRYEGTNIKHFYWSVITYGDECIPTKNGCRSGKKDRVQERIIEQINLPANQEIFNFCHY